MINRFSLHVTASQHILALIVLKRDETILIKFLDSFKFQMLVWGFFSVGFLIHSVQASTLSEDSFFVC